MLLAPSSQVAGFVAATYTFDEVCEVPVDTTVAGSRWTVRAGPLDLTFTVGHRSPLGLLLRAVPARLATAPAVRPEDTPAPAVAGHVLILNNERVLEGDVVRDGAVFRIRKGESEISIPARQALKVCTDRAAAYDYMRRRVNLGDPDERLRLARWCHTNELLTQARDEAKYALEMRPNHRETKQLLKLIEHGLGRHGKAPPPEPAPAAAAPELPRLDLSFETESAFRIRVQPILMNACVNCHTGGRGGAFQLTRVSESAPRAATQRNLAAVFAQVNLEKPTSSPLLVLAVSPHGSGNTPPLPARGAPAYRAIVTWLDRAVADNPHLVDRLAPALARKTPHPAVRPAAATVEVRAAAVVSRPVPRMEATAPRTLPASVTNAPPTVPPRPPQAAPTPPAVATPVDEFDPVIFNQQAPPKS
jgi:hypothetical protein